MSLIKLATDETPSCSSAFQGGRESDNFKSKGTKQSEENLPTFLVVQMDQEVSNARKYEILFWLNIQGVKRSRCIRQGVLIETRDFAQSRKFLNMKRLLSIDVNVSPHTFLNQRRGVITCKDLLKLSLTEIQKGLASQGVVSVKRITSNCKSDNAMVATKSVILTFNQLQLPKKIKLGKHDLPVRQYIPLPLRCFRCQRFGHISTYCRKPAMCECGRRLHEGEPCQPVSCVNCGGRHSSKSTDCPVYQNEVEIIKIKIERGLSFCEAELSSLLTCTPNNYGRVPENDRGYSGETIDDMLDSITDDIERNLRSIFLEFREFE